MSAIKQFLLVFYLNILGHEHGVGHGDAALEGVALLVELAEVALEHVTHRLIIVLHFLIVSAAAGHHVNLAVDQLVISLDVIIGHLVLIGEADGEFGSHGDIEHELEGSVAFQVLRHLFLGRHGLAEHLDFIVVDIFVHLLSEDLVDDVHLDSSAILALDQAHGHHTRSETRDISLLAILLQFVFYLLLVIFSLNGQGHQSIDLVGVFE